MYLTCRFFTGIRLGTVRPGQSSPRTNGAKIKREKQAFKPYGRYQIYIPNLDNTVVTIHAGFEKQIPDELQLYYEMINNHISTEVLDKAENIDDGLKHYNRHFLSFTPRTTLSTEAFYR